MWLRGCLIQVRSCPQPAQGPASPIPPTTGGPVGDSLLCPEVGCGARGIGVQVALSLVNKIQASSCLFKSHSLFNMRENLEIKLFFQANYILIDPFLLLPCGDCKFPVVLNLDRREHTWGELP